MLARKHLKNIITYKPGKPIQELKREFGLKRVIKLASNESPFSPPLPIRKAIYRASKDLNRYPDSSGYYLKKALSKKFKLKPENIILGNGSDEIVVLALKAWVEPCQEVIVGYPTFLIYEIQAKVNNLKVVRSNLKNFRYDLEDIKRKITKKTKLIFIANPDNPNGTYLTHQEIYSFLKNIPKNVIVFLDEAYFEFAPQDFPQSIDFLKQGYNIIFTRTFSKAYGLAGLRIGCGFTKRELIQALEKVREPFNVNSLALLSAELSLKEKKYLKNTVSYIQREKLYFYQELKKLGISYVESATNFLLINLKSFSSQKLFNYCLKRGIIIREMTPWGYKNFVRVTVGKHSENREFIKVLKSFLNKEAKK
ncbi:MAG TPA: histidinol-phosphate transaminase [Candidatus Omnitrophica bacterium]|nr:histidinol-phosphate transaminase [Candidatus Omnitrophota bacterium]